uniref:Reverse transcriptase/retrotransposon-derived protein RNase H-like domain-containing protein n=1 Tax=Nicotiana tabacum TaxID=4097 RepID=A0A1S3Y4T6_TOBAC|nr:PREDICTED: uncharacterized protein LOC107771934 [Nicotiana tabacum]
MRVDNQEAVFNVYQDIQLPHHYEDLAMISVVEINEPVVEPSAFKEDALENALMLFNHLELEERVEEMLQILDASCEYIRERSQFEPLDRPIGPPPKPSVKEAPKLELKPLPSHLHYAYLRSSNTLPVIVSSYLSNLQEEKLLRVLREHKHAIGWTMSNIKGTSPTFCMHKILMEEGHKRSMEHQRCLNPIMKEVVRKEVINLLDAGFYRQFIKDFSKVSSPLCRLLEKDMPFKFNDACLKAFEELKKKLVSAPIIVAPDWNEPFELMCDASDGAIRAVLGQRRSKIFHSIYYARKTLTHAQINYTLTEKELLVVVWAFDKFRAYLVAPKSSSTQTKQSSRFDLEIRDSKGRENQVVDHLSRLETRSHVAEGDFIKETFLDKQLLDVTVREVPWYADFVNYLASGEMPPDLEPHAKNTFLRDVRSYVWDQPFLFKSCTDQLIRRCMPESKINVILHDCHASSYGGHHAGDKTAANVL